jgi:chemotaxis protein MotB
MARGGKGEQRPIIIKRIKKVAGGHHGGAWKVAYADFVTAMMAFFMLLWLLTVSDKIVLQGIADYFTPSNSTMSNDSGAGKILGGTEMSKEGAKSSGSAAESAQANEDADTADAQQQAAADKGEVGAMSIPSPMAPSPMPRTRQPEEDIRAAMQQNPELIRHRDQIILEETPEGLRIQLIDRDQRPMFKTGTAELNDYGVRVLGQIGELVARLPNRVQITGHTDAMGGSGLYTNWELSADRANAARRILRAAGVTEDRVAEVTGRAATDPLYPDAPDRPENRRIALLLLREAPVLEPNFGDR